MSNWRRADPRNFYANYAGFGGDEDPIRAMKNAGPSNNSGGEDFLRNIGDRLMDEGIDRGMDALSDPLGTVEDLASGNIPLPGQGSGLVPDLGTADDVGWLEPEQFTNGNLRAIAAKAKKSGPSMAFQPKKKLPAIDRMVRHLRAAKKTINDIKELVDAGHATPRQAQRLQAMARNYFEAASGLMRNTKRPGGDAVTTILFDGLVTYGTTHRGVKWPVASMAFANEGGDAWAQRLSNNASQLLREVDAARQEAKAATTREEALAHKKAGDAARRERQRQAMKDRRERRRKLREAREAEATSSTTSTTTTSTTTNDQANNSGGSSGALGILAVAAIGLGGIYYVSRSR